MLKLVFGVLIFVEDVEAEVKIMKLSKLVEVVGVVRFDKFVKAFKVV